MAVRASTAIVAAILGAALLVPAARAAGARPCRPSQVRATVLGTSGPPTNTDTTLAVRNAGRSVCTVQGPPGVALLGAGDRQLTAKSFDQAGYPTPIVTIAPGKRAYTTFAYVAGSRCPRRAYRIDAVYLALAGVRGGFLVHLPAPLLACPGPRAFPSLVLDVFPFRATRALPAL